MRLLLKIPNFVICVCVSDTTGTSDVRKESIEGPEVPISFMLLFPLAVCL